MSFVPSGAILYKIPLDQMRGDVVSRVKKYAATINVGGRAGVFSSVIGGYVVRVTKDSHPPYATKTTAVRAEDWILTVTPSVYLDGSVADEFGIRIIDNPVVYTGGLVAAGVRVNPIYARENTSDVVTDGMLLSWDTDTSITAKGASTGVLSLSPEAHVFIGATSTTVSRIAAAIGVVSESNWVRYSGALGTVVTGGAHRVRSSGGESLGGALHGSIEVFIPPAWAEGVFGEHIHLPPTIPHFIARGIHRQKYNPPLMAKGLLDGKSVLVVAAVTATMGYATGTKTLDPNPSVVQAIQPIPSDNVSGFGVAVYDISRAPDEKELFFEDRLLGKYHTTVREFEGGESAAAAIEIHPDNEFVSGTGVQRNHILNCSTAFRSEESMFFPPPTGDGGEDDSVKRFGKGKLGFLTGVASVFLEKIGDTSVSHMSSRLFIGEFSNGDFSQKEEVLHTATHSYTPPPPGQSEPIIVPPEEVTRVFFYAAAGFCLPMVRCTSLPDLNPPKAELSLAYVVDGGYTEVKLDTSGFLPPHPALASRAVCGTYPVDVAGESYVTFMYNWTQREFQNKYDTHTDTALDGTAHPNFPQRKSPIPQPPVPPGGVEKAYREASPFVGFDFLGPRNGAPVGADFLSAQELYDKTNVADLDELDEGEWFTSKRFVNSDTSSQHICAFLSPETVVVLLTKIVGKVRLDFFVAAYDLESGRRLWVSEPLPRTPQFPNGYPLEYTCAPCISVMRSEHGGTPGAICVSLQARGVPGYYMNAYTYTYSGGVYRNTFPMASKRIPKSGEGQDRRRVSINTHYTHAAVGYIPDPIEDRDDNFFFGNFNFITYDSGKSWDNFLWGVGRPIPAGNVIAGSDNTLW